MTTRVNVLALIVLLVSAAPATAQSIAGSARARITDRMVVGGSTFGEVLRVVGSPTVSSGTGTMNPFVLDADGDGLEDSNTTVSTAGAWTWGSAGHFSSTLGVTGATTLSSTLSVGGVTTLSSTAPVFRIYDSNAGSSEKYTILEADGGLLSLRLYDDTPSSSNAVFQLDRDALAPGDWRWGSLMRTIRPENNGGSVLGSYTKMYETAYIWDLVVGTLTAKEIIATIGGEIIVAPTTSLTRDVAPGDTIIYTKHNQPRVNDTLYLKVNGSAEKILVGAGPTDCSVSGNCSVTGTDYAYNVTRNRAGSGAKTWLAGAAVVNEGNTGDGFISIYADRSSSVSDGYVGTVVGDGPLRYFRMSADTATTNTDQMGSGSVATEGGTQSSGLGVAATAWSSVADPIWENLGGAGYLSVPDAADLRITADLTISFFAAWQRTTPRTEFIVSKHWTAEYHVEVASNGTLRFCHGTSVGPSFTCVDSAAGYMPNDTLTHHYAIVRDSVSSPKRILFYKDGVLTNTFTYTQSVTTSTNNVVIGSNPTSLSGNEFDGYIDEVAIWNVQVPGDRIAVHYASATNGSVSKFTIGPTLCGNVRTGTAAFAIAERWCLGNLAGTYGYNSTTPVYGLASGNLSATWISVDATNGFRIMNGTTVKTSFDTSGNGSLTGDLSIGTSGSLRSGATAYDTTTGYWLDYNGGSPRFRIGTTSAGTSYLRWTGSALEVKSNTVSINSSGVSIASAAASSFNTLNGLTWTSSTLALSQFGLTGAANAGGSGLYLYNVNAAGQPATIDIAIGNGGANDGISMSTTAWFTRINSTHSVNGTATAHGTYSCLSVGQAVRSIDVERGYVMGVTCGTP